MVLFCSYIMAILLLPWQCHFARGIPPLQMCTVVSGLFKCTLFLVGCTWDLHDRCEHDEHGLFWATMFLFSWCGWCALSLASIQVCQQVNTLKQLIHMMAPGSAWSGVGILWNIDICAQMFELWYSWMLTDAMMNKVAYTSVYTITVFEGAKKGSFQ